MELIGITLIVILVILFYIIYNLYRKNVSYEMHIEQLHDTTSDVLLKMKKIDSSGVFEADDEVGTVFAGLSAVLKQIENLIYDQKN